MIRWQCPEGAHPAVLAPTRLRKLDVRRYCLRCSERSGWLTERVSPSLEAKRAERAERATVKRTTTKARVHAAAYVVEGIDCLALMKSLAVLPVYGGRKGVAYKRVMDERTKLVIHRCRHPKRRKAGYYEWGGDIHLFAYPGITEASLREVLLHELLHCAQRAWPCYNTTCKIHHCRHFVAKEKVAWRQAERKLGKLDGAIAAGTNRHYLVNGATPEVREAARVHKLNLSVKRELKRRGWDSTRLTTSWLEGMSKLGSTHAEKILERRKQMAAHYDSLVAPDTAAD